MSMHSPGQGDSDWVLTESATESSCRVEVADVAKSLRRLQCETQLTDERGYPTTSSTMNVR